MATRSTGQLWFTVGVLLIGVWFGIQFLDATRTLEEPRLLELHDVDLAGLYQHFPAEQLPLPEGTQHISTRYRLLPDPDGQYQVVWRMQLPLNHVRDTTAHMVANLLGSGARLRPYEDLPPEWWPTFRDQPDHQFRLPEWFDPQGSQALVQYFADPNSDQIVGDYVNIDPATGWLHYWRWRMRGVALPPSPLDRLTADTLVLHLAARAAERKVEPIEDGWLQLHTRDSADLEVAGNLVPPDLQGVDAWYQSATRTYLLVFHGVGEETAAAMVGERALWPLPDDGPVPVEQWSWALPPVTDADGNRRLPSWFAPGPGPRWAHSQVVPGAGTVERARWVAYDPAARALFVWDWSTNAPRGASVDLLAGRGGPGSTTTTERVDDEQEQTAGDQADTDQN